MNSRTPKCLALRQTGENLLGTHPWGSKWRELQFAKRYDRVANSSTNIRRAWPTNWFILKIPSREEGVQAPVLLMKQSEHWASPVLRNYSEELY